MTARILALFLLLTSLFVSPALMHECRAQDSGGFAPLTMTGTAQVRAAVDPLTLLLADGRTVRLAALDIPDFDPYAPGDFSVAALALLKKDFEGKEVHLYQTPDSGKGRTNRMGQIIAHVESVQEKVWAQGLLLSEGLARVRTTADNPELAVRMYALESKARAEEKGLWGLTGFPVLNPVSSERHIGSFQVVEGTVQSAAVVNNRIYLNFGDDWRRDFTVSIDPAARRLFNKAGLDPLQWSGKTIRVRGWLESYNGPSIQVSHPEAVEFEDSAKEQPPPLQRAVSPPMLGQP